jgi:hypothetical protein
LIKDSDPKEKYLPGVEGATRVHENAFQPQILQEEWVGCGENLLTELVDIKHP